MPLGRHNQGPTPSGANFGIVNSGSINGPVQAAPFSSNASQINNITPGAVERAHESITELRHHLETLRFQHPEAEQALQALDEIGPRLTTPVTDPGALRVMLQVLTTASSAIPSVVSAAEAVHSAVTALLPN